MTDASKESSGALLILISTLFFSIMSLGVKVLRPVIDPPSLVFYQSLMQTLILVPFVLGSYKQNGEVKFYDRFKIHILRGGFGIFSMLSFYYAVQLLPLGLSNLLAMTSAFWATLFSWFFLGETVNKKQMIFGVVTCMGIGLSIVDKDPLGGSSFLWNLSGLGIICGLLSGLLRGGALSSLRRLRKKELGIVEIVFFFGVCGLVATAPPFIKASSSHHFDKSSLLWLLVVGLSGTFGQLLLTAGFRHTRALMGSICTFPSLIINVGFGFVFLGELPPLPFFMGVGLAILGFAGLAYFGSSERRAELLRT